MEKDIIYVIESQDYIFVADTLEKAEEIADRLAMDIFGHDKGFKIEHIKKDQRCLKCKDPYDREENISYEGEYVATIKVCKMNFCRYDKNGKYIKGYNFGEEV